LISHALSFVGLRHVRCGGLSEQEAQLSLEIEGRRTRRPTCRCWKASSANKFRVMWKGLCHFLLVFNINIGTYLSPFLRCDRRTYCLATIHTLGTEGRCDKQTDRHSWDRQAVP